MAVAPLRPRTLHILALVVLLAQAGHYIHLPVWIALVGSTLVLARIALAYRGIRLPGSIILSIVAALLAAGIRWHYGYFIGRDPCVAFLYVLVGIKFLEARRDRDFTMVVCLAAFLALGVYFYRQSLLLVLLAVAFSAATGLAWLELGRAGPSAADWRQELKRVFVLILQGAPIAFACFLLFPRISSPLWGVPYDTYARTGLSDRMSPGSISELSRSDEIAFRVDFAGPVPERRERYWRAIVLTRFDGVEWSPGRRIPAGSASEPERARQSSYTVTLEPHQQRWLVALDLPVAPPLSLTAAEDENPNVGTLGQDRTILAHSRVTQPFRYQAISSIGTRHVDSKLISLETERLLPRQGNSRSRALASSLRTNVDTDREFVNAVFRWFATERFRYTLTPALMLDEVVDQFLFDKRAGFCEHFAGSFVFLARAAGIPARVVTGYQGGELNGSYMIVRESDAHAWAEVFLDGRWERVDPTAAVAPDRIEHGLGAALPESEPIPRFARLDLTFLTRLQLRWDRVNHEWARLVVGFNADRQKSLARQLGIPTPAAWEGIALLGLIGVAWAGALIGWSRWRTARIDPALRLWQQFCRRGRRAGVPRLPEDGPLAYGNKLAARFPDAGPAIARIVRAYIARRYGAPSGSDSHEQEMRVGLRELRLRRRAPAATKRAPAGSD